MISKQHLLQSLAHLRYCVEHQQEAAQMAQAQQDFDAKVREFCAAHLESEHAFVSEVLEEYQAVIESLSARKAQAKDELIEQRKSTKSVAAYKDNL